MNANKLQGFFETHIFYAIGGDVIRYVRIHPIVSNQLDFLPSDKKIKFCKILKLRREGIYSLSFKMADGYKDFVVIHEHELLNV